MKRFYSLVAIGVIFAYCVDRLTKYAAIHFLQEPQVLLPGVLEFEFIQNPKFLFYLHLPFAVSITIITAVLFFLLYITVKEYHAKHHAEVAVLLFIAAGAFSNLLDRISFGHVVDFINVPFWSVFNLADIYIVAGAVIFFILTLREQKKSAR